MTMRITIFDPETSQTTVHGFEHSPVRIGRDPTSDLLLPFAFVSSRHAALEFDDDHARLVDAGSTNGILREGRRLPARQAITINDAITVTIGRLELEIRRLAPGSQHLSSPPPGSDAHAIASIHAAIRQLRPLHAEILRTRAAFTTARDALLDGITPDARDLAAAMLLREFPDAT